MSIAIWSSRFETGIEAIDTQHKGLFAAINDLAESFKGGSSQAQARESLAFLARYTVEHFQAEERFMREATYPAFAAHASDHANLVSRLRAFQDKEASGKVVTMDVAIFLLEWLKQHICDADMRFVAFLKDQPRR
ncbi:bacteriohemerythrin [Geothrix sp. PMB-07]|uniref:bacteriohemerythrin n=1 Tax=Geothrix sp. PMB-07 TaxID=3068640 RepID=UPI002740CFCC|nr:bacteriohemerythrin [Geothrix sp. PMB-07]WLT30319.1 bacteriohemerythrin [Geothrix sp. PMB-07]